MPLSDPANVLQEAKLKIEEDGGLLLPSTFLTALGIKAGDEIVLRLEDHELCIRKESHAKRSARKSRR